MKQSERNIKGNNAPEYIFKKSKIIFIILFIFLKDVIT